MGPILKVEKFNSFDPNTKIYLTDAVAAIVRVAVRVAASVRE
ncbi:MAG: hypothetical protein ACYT04_57755 [Nostoc sp.]